MIFQETLRFFFCLRYLKEL